MPLAFSQTGNMHTHALVTKEKARIQFEDSKHVWRLTGPGSRVSCWLTSQLEVLAITTQLMPASFEVECNKALRAPYCIVDI